VARDYAEAVKLYRKSAEQGFMFAQYFLGVHYLRKAVPRDYAEAAKWMRKAAEQGNATAQIQLGVMYQEGIGVPRDYAGAYMWFSLAAAKGHEDARKALDAIRPVMTPDQIAEAQKRTAAWKPSR
jgi:TPR repeat protein